MVLPDVTDLGFHKKLWGVFCFNKDSHTTLPGFIWHPLLLRLSVLVARRNSRGYRAARKNAVRGSAVENGSTALCSPSAARARWLFLLSSFFFSYTILTSTERGDSAVENLSSLHY